ncbi:type II toxin-antitoxin system VapC family toxin [Pedobacter xixiisoli]|uniref:Predicted nucleic acid-binding protein, contains PIN domain n=1 Tax=Pedobacter xixiisoli TaxID=1476464 RepID=A0A286AES5_9SPHI|nr:PIN domain-containing protein [Pedobacter xixiisoli]SOD20403.1 Predicted nucleic acid-binding protein, contains PIN domain [Pedobacter xixiisoli]
MGFNVFLDANFLLDFLLNRKGYDIALQLLLLAKKRKLIAFTNPSIIQTVSFYIQKDFNVTTSKALLKELLKVVNLIETCPEAVYNALNSSIKDIEDAIHYYTAIEHQMDYIITNDINFLKLNGTALNIKTPEQFLQLLQA